MVARCARGKPTGPPAVRTGGGIRTHNLSDGRLTSSAPLYPARWALGRLSLHLATVHFLDSGQSTTCNRKVASLIAGSWEIELASFRRGVPEQDTLTLTATAELPPCVADTALGM